MSYAKILVIGFGNTLRRDDGIGPRMAHRIAQWGIPGVTALSVHQLVPELVEEMRGSDRVLFIDASSTDDLNSITLHRIEPKESRSSLGHFSDPAQLLAMSLALDGRPPETWLLGVACQSFEFGDSISERTAENAEAGLRWIRHWLEDCNACTKSA